MSDIAIRKATAADIDAVTRIYTLIHKQEEAGETTIGWDSATYPVRQTAEDALAAGELFVMTIDNHVAASAIINKRQPAAYSRVKWDFEATDDAVGVLHTLTVAPDSGHLGLGRRFVAFFEEYSQHNGCQVARLDTQEKNSRALNFYPRLGYSLRDIIVTEFETLPNPVRLALFEKRL